MVLARRKRWIRIAIAGLGIYLGVCFAVAWMVVRPRRMPVSEPPAGFSKVNVDSKDHRVPAWVTSGRSDRPVFIFAHPLRSTPDTWRLAAQHLREKGYGVVVLTMRASCDNPAQSIGFGAGEADEVVSAGQYCQTNLPGRPIISVGCSMGGAAVWLASERAPSLFRAVVSDSAYSDLGSGANDWLDSRIPFGRWLLAPVKWIGPWISGVDLKSPDAEHAARLWRGKPSLVIHGNRDTLFGTEHAHRIASAAGITPWILPDGEHGTNYSRHVAEYESRLEVIAKE